MWNFYIDSWKSLNTMYCFPVCREDPNIREQRYSIKEYILTELLETYARSSIKHLIKLYKFLSGIEGMTDGRVNWEIYCEKSRNTAYSLRLGAFVCMLITAL